MTKNGKSILDEVILFGGGGSDDSSSSSGSNCTNCTPGNYSSTKKENLDEGGEYA